MASHASAQIELDWWNAYDLPESFDGDSFTSSVVVNANGAVLTAVRGLFPERSRFVRFSSAGAVASSVLAPAPFTFADSLLAPSGDAYFAGAGTSPTQGYMLVKLSSTGAVLWSQLVTAGAFMQRAEVVLDAGGNVALVAANQTTGRTFARGFTPAGAPAYSHELDLGPSSESVQEALLGANGEIIVAGGVDTRAVVAGIDTTTGQLLWSEINAGALGLGARYSALARRGNGQLAAAGVSTLAGSGDVWVTAFDAAGAVQWSTAIDAGANAVETVNDAEFASDGALWVCGSTFSSGQTASFFLRFPPGSNTPERLLWNNAPGVVWSNAKQLALGGPGQLWALTELLPFAEAISVGAVQLDFDNGLRAELLARFDQGGAEKSLFCAASGGAQKLVVGGRSEDVPGGSSFFDPVSMVGRFDVSDAPREYCQAQTNSAGCVPVLTCAGRASVATTQAFRLRVGDVIPGAAGLFVYGATGASSTPFLGGLKCVASPIARSPMLSAATSGSAPCPGELSIDWNAFARGQLGGAPAPVLSAPGTAIYVQCWSRDGASAFGANLSSALRYVVLP